MAGASIQSANCQCGDADCRLWLEHGFSGDHSPNLTPVPGKEVLLEIIGHLGAAVSQALPSDDQIIMEHVLAAHGLASLLRRAQS